MRILCLHGTAINSSIFQSKTEKLRSFLPSEYSYEWLDGDLEIIPQKQLANVYPGPYLTFIDVLTTQGIARALSRINEFIESDGPFDGVMGVSEGSMLSASLVLKHQIENPFSPPLFRFAIFISGTLPFSWSESLGHDAYNLIMSENPLNTSASDWERQRKLGLAYLQPIHNSESSVLTEMFPAWEEGRQYLLELIEKPENAHLRPRCFHPDIHQERISIPTAHVWGAGDSFRSHAKELVRLCEPSVAAVYEHGGLHDVPHSLEDNKIVSEMVQKTILRSEFAI